MLRWVAIASVIRVKSRKEGFVLRCKTGLSSYLVPGLEVRFIPPVLDCARVATVKEVWAVDGDEVQVSFTEAFDTASAGKMVGMQVLVDAAALPDAALLSEPDVTSWPVEDARFGLLGEVSEVISGPAQRLLVVQASEDLVPDHSAEILIPFVQELVEVDVAAKRLLSRIPEGLLNLEG